MFFRAGILYFSTIISCRKVLPLASSSFFYKFTLNIHLNLGSTASIFLIDIIHNLRDSDILSFSAIFSHSGRLWNLQKKSSIFTLFQAYSKLIQSFTLPQRNAIQTVKRSQRLGLSHVKSTFSQHSFFIQHLFFLHNRSSNIGYFSATLRFLHWCVWGGVLPQPEWRSQLTEWGGAQKYSQELISVSSRIFFQQQGQALRGAVAA